MYEDACEDASTCMWKYGGQAYWGQDEKRVCQSLTPDLRVEPLGTAVPAEVEKGAGNKHGGQRHNPS